MTADAPPPLDSAAHRSDPTGDPPAGTGDGSPPSAADHPPPSFAAIDTHDDLLSWSATYCERTVEVFEMAVDLALVDWAVSTRAKRRAAAVKRPRLPDATVGEPIDWATVEDDGGGTDGRPPRCTVVLTRAAFEAFDRETWTGVLRHELVHIEQFQRYGTTDHGPAFRRRARAVDASRSCPRFAAPKYRLRCGRCGEVVARRYRDCKLVREHDSYRSACCRAGLDCERPDATRVQ